MRTTRNKDKRKNGASRLDTTTSKKGTTPGTLFLSFWNVCLENLPEGTFTRRRIALDEAKRRINEAQKQHRFLCVSEDDLLAPYHGHERDNHAALCGVLKAHYDITLSLTEFTSKDRVKGRSSYSVNPLICVQIKGSDRLLVVTCMFSMETKRRVDSLTFKLDPSTVEFHLIESVGPATTPSKARTRKTSQNDAEQAS